MRKIKTAVIGTGFMGKVHVEQIRRLGNVEVAAVAGIDEPNARPFAEAIGPCIVRCPHRRFRLVNTCYAKCRSP